MPVEAAGAEDAIAAGSPGFAGCASVALTCRSVTTFGGISVMMVAESLSLVWRSASCTGYPCLYSLIPRLSTSPWLYILMPFGPRMITLFPDTCITVPSRISVT